MSHVDEGALHAYLDGALDEYPAADAERIRMHLDACAECAGRLEVERRVRSDAHAMLGLAAPVVDVPSLEELRAYVQRTARQRRGISRIQRMGWAASVVLALGAGWMLRDGQLQSRAMDISGEINARSGVSTAAEAPPQMELLESLEEGDVTAGEEFRSDRDISAAVRPAAAQEARRQAPSAVSAGSGVAAEAELSKVNAPLADAVVAGPRPQVAGPPREEPLPESLDRLERYEDAAVAEAIATPTDAPTSASPLGDSTMGAQRATDVGEVVGLTAGTEEQMALAADSGARANEESPGRRARESADLPPSVVANAARIDPALAAGGADADAPARSLVVEMEAADDEAVAEPLLSVPGHEVVDVTNLGEGSTPWGARVRQRTEDGRSFEVFHLEPGIDPSILPPMEAGAGEASAETPFGWVLVRGGMEDAELRGLLLQLFPEAP